MTGSFDFFSPISKEEWDKKKKQIAQYDEKELDKVSGHETITTQQLLDISRQSNPAEDVVDEGYSDGLGNNI